MENSYEIVSPPPKKILVFDLFTNFGWIFGNFFTSIFVGSSTNLKAVISSKTFIISILIAVLSPIIKQKLFFSCNYKLERKSRKSKEKHTKV